MMGLNTKIFLSALLLSSCVVTRQEINAVMFLHERIPSELCENSPELKKIGIYRVINCTPRLVEIGACRQGQDQVREKLSYCKTQIENYFSVKDTELEAILKRTNIK